MASIQVGAQTYRVTADASEARTKVQRALEGLVVTFELTDGGTLLIGAAAGAVVVMETPELSTGSDLQA
jgi:hypothetical protein